MSDSAQQTGGTAAGPRTMYDKIWDAHVVKQLSDNRALLFVDRHLLHDGVATYAYTGLKARGLSVRRPELTLAVTDHVVPTTARDVELTYEDDDARRMVADIESGSAAAGITVYSVNDPRQGIVHVVGPEQGFIVPGAVVACADSHTSTHGAFGALAFGIGISEVEHILATQTIVQRRAKSMCVRVDGELAAGTGAKDLMLSILRHIGVAGGTGHVIEYQGDAIAQLSMEQRMTLCNMSIEAGAKAGMVAPDETTFEYLRGRPFAPSGELWAQAMDYWKTLPGDAGAQFDSEIELPGSAVTPHVTWGTNPGQALPIEDRVPDPGRINNPGTRRAVHKAIDYMGLSAGQALQDVSIDRVFIGSCTNGRIEDLRAAAQIARGRKVADGVTAWVVPGSGLVKAQAEAEGLDRIFIEANFEWREPGCSMCLAMNGELLELGQRCASTSNRNFEGRQGPNGRTHLMSPAMAAAAAISGRLADVRDFL